MPHAELQLEAHPSNVGNARRFVRQALTGWGREDMEMSAELVVSELVSNSVLHARSPLQLQIRLDDAGLLIEVGDESSTEPVRRRYAADATTGRGLSLVAALTDDDWGCRATEDGKVVWARIPTEESGREAEWQTVGAFEAGGHDAPRSGGPVGGASVLAA